MKDFNKIMADEVKLFRCRTHGKNPQAKISGQNISFDFCCTLFKNEIEKKLEPIVDKVIQIMLKDIFN